MKITESQAKVIWLVCVHICGASRFLDDMDDFVRYAQEEEPLEFRFQGKLGFGGKLYFALPPRVSCYPEDETPDRKEMVDHANQFLSTLAESWIE